VREAAKHPFFRGSAPEVRPHSLGGDVTRRRRLSQISALEALLVVRNRSRRQLEFAEAAGQRLPRSKAVHAKWPSRRTATLGFSSFARTGTPDVPYLSTETAEQSSPSTSTSRLRSLILSALFALPVVAEPLLAGTLSAAEEKKIQFPAASQRSVVKQRVGLTDVEVDYSRPNKNDREIWRNTDGFVMISSRARGEHEKNAFS
jgi:hypothetical protein